MHLPLCSPLFVVWDAFAIKHMYLINKTLPVLFFSSLQMTRVSQTTNKGEIKAKKGEIKAKCRFFACTSVI
ncbi:unnamed protein product [Schistosoma mansoni]|uniref:Smp_206000 n=1 Tax=Schistosoma mansoni TaxID=6183 RepID=UPI00022C8724|nr:unnamed protein product [Schistosoma mansoni]|eukprot:XP_018644800.1 unnamed protein product [Schistosoma mansoni]